MSELGDFTEVGPNPLRLTAGPCAQKAPDTRKGKAEPLSGF